MVAQHRSGAGRKKDTAAQARGADVAGGHPLFRDSDGPDGGFPSLQFAA